MQSSETPKTLIAEDVEITGSIKCASNLRLDGKLNGDMVCNGDVVIGNSAVVKGNLSANCVSVEGQISGNITARDRIELKSTTRLTGDIKSKRLTVEDGVTFVGKSEVNPSGSSAAKVPETKASVHEPAAVAEPAGEDSDERARGKPGSLFGRK